MSERQWRTQSLLERLERGELTVSEVAASLGRSVRQVQRIRKRWQAEGQVALVHGNTGRAPRHKTTAEVRDQIVELRRTKYAGFNDQHFAEKLLETEEIAVSRETVRRVLSAQAKGRVERLWGVLQDRLSSELRLAQARTRGQANQVLRAYRVEHNRRFAVPPRDAQSAWRKAPSDHTDLLDLCALQYVRKVYKNNTIRIGGRGIDIPRSRDGGPSTYAGKVVVVKHQLSGAYRVFCDDKLIAWVEGERPKDNTVRGPRSLSAYRTRQRRRETRNHNDEDHEGDTFT